MSEWVFRGQLGTGAIYAGTQHLHATSMLEEDGLALCLAHNKEVRELREHINKLAMALEFNTQIHDKPNI